MNESVENETKQMGTIEFDKYTQMKGNFPEIIEPRWNDRTILIQADVKDHNKVKCIYEKSDGSLMFPEPLYVSGATAKKYKAFDMPTARGGVIRMRAVPIDEFKILKISERSIHDF